MICAILLILSVMLSKRKGNELLTPAVLYFAIWLGMFLLYDFDNNTIGLFSPSHSYDVSPFATRLFAESFVFFFVGVFIVDTMMSPVGRLVERRQIVGISRELPSQEDTLFRLTKLFAVLFVLGVIIKYAILVQQYGVNPLEILDEIRRAKAMNLDQRSFPFVLGFQSIAANMLFLNLGVLLATSKKRSVKYLVLFMLVFAYLDDTTGADKGSIKLALELLFTWFITAATLENQRLPLKFYTKIGGVFVLFFLLLSSITFLRTLPVMSSNLVIGGTFSLSNEGEVLSFVLGGHVYNNLLGNIPSTAWMFDNPALSIYPGDNTFVDVYRILDSILNSIFGHGLFSDADRLQKIIGYQANLGEYGIFNTVSHLGYYYSDFGELGVIVFSLLLGLFSSYFYERARQYKHVPSIQIAAMLMATIVYTVRSVLYAGANFWLTLPLIVIQARLLSRTNRHLGTSNEARTGSTSMNGQATQIPH